MLRLPRPRSFRISKKPLSNNLIFISLFYFFIVLKKITINTASHGTRKSSIMYFYSFLDQEQQRSSQSSPSSQAVSADGSEHRNTLLTIGFAVISMTVYALVSGLIQVEITTTGDSDDTDSEFTPDMSAFSFREEKQNNENSAR